MNDLWSLAWYDIHGRIQCQWIMHIIWLISNVLMVMLKRCRGNVSKWYIGTLYEGIIRIFGWMPIITTNHYHSLPHTILSYTIPYHWPYTISYHTQGIWLWCHYVIDDANFNDPYYTIPCTIIPYHHIISILYHIYIISYHMWDISPRPTGPIDDIYSLRPLHGHSYGTITDAFTGIWSYIGGATPWCGTLYDGDTNHSPRRRAITMQSSIIHQRLITCINNACISVHVCIWYLGCVIPQQNTIKLVITP